MGAMRTLLVVILALCLAGCISSAAAVATTYTLASPRSALCVTHGTSTSSTAVATDDPEYRAFAPSTTGTSAALSLTGTGVTDPQVPLASGKYRHQVCLKLRASDGCNLTYACWRLEPHPQIVVQVKSNPGQVSADQCGAGGYTTITPTWSVAVPTFVGGLHSIEATLDGADLAVSVDGAPAWTGTVTDAALLVNGPAGIRSDNERWSGAFSAELDCTSVLSD
jgi:hypothetical protein